MPIDNRNGLTVGVFVDVANIAQNGGYGMRYEVLREFATRDGSDPARLNAYVVYDEDRGGNDPEYRDRSRAFHYVLRDFGYKVIEKVVRWYTDESGNRYGKANADLDMAVDMLLQAPSFDRVILATGDGDFVRVVHALQGKGCRVELLAFKNVSRDLRNEADAFFSGFLIPGLLPIVEDQGKAAWDVGGRVRGTCYTFNAEKHFGFFRYLKQISPDLWITDTRRGDSPFGTAFVHESSLPRDLPVDLLPSRDLIFEFNLVASDRGLQATDISIVCRY